MTVILKDFHSSTKNGSAGQNVQNLTIIWNITANAAIRKQCSWNMMAARLVIVRNGSTRIPESLGKHLMSKTPQRPVPEFQKAGDRT